MRKADKYFLENLTRLKYDSSYSKNISDSVRAKYSKDNSPAHYRFISNVFETYDIRKGEIPIISLRKIPYVSGLKEILWIYQDQSNDLRVLKDKYNIKWWDQWDIGDGTIGHRYGYIVRKYNLIDTLIYKLTNNPNDRDISMNLNQYVDLNSTDGLRSCAYETRWVVNEDKYLDCTLYCRSQDYLVAGHINRIQYFFLFAMIAQVTGLKMRFFNVMVTNLHYYDNQEEQFEEMLNTLYKSKDLLDYIEEPRLEINEDKKDFYKFTVKDISLTNYNYVETKVKFDDLAI